MTFWSLKVTSILLFLAISPLNQMLRSGEQREWSPTKKALYCEKKFSLLAPEEMYGEQYGDYAYWY